MNATTYHPNLLAALPIINEATRGSMRVEYLTGPSNAAYRASILARLRGVSKMPKSAAGINALMSECYAITGVTGSCPAVRYQNFAAYCKAAMSESAN
jgi:hypothetical protein